MRSFDAWHLPGLAPDELTLATYTFGSLSVRAPVLTVTQLQRVIAHVTAARANVLKQMPRAEIVSAIDAAAERVVRDEQTAELLTDVTGYSRATVDDVLAHMARDWSTASLARLLQQELGEAAPTATLVSGPRLAFHVFSGNVPGVAVTSIIRSLLVRAATLGKTASGEPVLPVLFAGALGAVQPRLADCLAVTYWPGGSEPLENVALEAADAIIVYGGAETVRSIAARAGVETRLVVHGPRQSLGVVGRNASLAVAPAIARATAAYDQQGCVSPHVVYVERGGSLDARALARAVAAELKSLAMSLPRRTVSAGEAIAIRDARTRAEFRDDAEVFAADDTSYTVIYDEDDALVTSCLNRTLYVKPIDDVSVLNVLLAPHRDVLQSVALAGFSAAQRTAIFHQLSECGVTRITTFEELPWPPMWWHHDGRGPLQELLFWHDLES